MPTTPPPATDATRRLDRARSVLLVVDIQERLAPHILHGDALQARSSVLINAARRFGVPVLATEHCPDQIGELVAGLRRQFAAGEIFVKTLFGAAKRSAAIRSSSPGSRHTSACCRRCSASRREDFR